MAPVRLPRTPNANHESSSNARRYSPSGTSLSPCGRSPVRPPAADPTLRPFTFTTGGTYEGTITYSRMTDMDSTSVPDTFASASISAKPCSAVEILARRRIVSTLTPARAHAALSMFRVVKPYF